jgi:hypothetical protein
MQLVASNQGHSLCTVRLFSSAFVFQVFWDGCTMLRTPERIGHCVLVLTTSRMAVFKCHCVLYLISQLPFYAVGCPDLLIIRPQHPASSLYVFHWSLRDTSQACRVACLSSSSQSPGKFKWIYIAHQAASSESTLVT